MRQATLAVSTTVGNNVDAGVDVGVGAGVALGGTSVAVGGTAVAVGCITWGTAVKTGAGVGVDVLQAEISVAINAIMIMDLFIGLLFPFQTDWLYIFILSTKYVETIEKMRCICG